MPLNYILMKKLLWKFLLTDLSTSPPGQKVTQVFSLNCCDSKAGFLKFRGFLVIICCNQTLEYDSHICLGGTERYGVMLRFKQFDCPVPPNFGYKTRHFNVSRQWFIRIYDVNSKHWLFFAHHKLGRSISTLAGLCYCVLLWW